MKSLKRPALFTNLRNAVIVAVAVGGTQAAHATSYTWGGGTNTWPAGWTPSGTPGSSDSISYTGTGTTTTLGGTQLINSISVALGQWQPGAHQLRHPDHRQRRRYGDLGLPDPRFAVELRPDQHRGEPIVVQLRQYDDGQRRHRQLRRQRHADAHDGRHRRDGPGRYNRQCSSGGVVGVTWGGNSNVTISGNNSYTGGLTTSAGTGTLFLGSATAMGTGTFTLHGGTVQNSSGAAVTYTSPAAVLVTGNTSFSGTGASTGISWGSGLTTIIGPNSYTLSNNTGRVPDLQWKRHRHRHSRHGWQQLVAIPGQHQSFEPHRRRLQRHLRQRYDG